MTKEKATRRVTKAESGSPSKAAGAQKKNKKEDEEQTKLPHFMIVGAFTNAWCFYVTLGLH